MPKRKWFFTGRRPLHYYMPSLPPIRAMRWRNWSTIPPTEPSDLDGYLRANLAAETEQCLYRNRAVGWGDTLIQI